MASQKEDDGVKAAVIGIGSNSVRMLLAQLQGNHGRRLLRDREGTRLFAGLDSEGRLSAESMDSTAASVQRMAELARTQGAEEISLFATSATRDAANRDTFAQLLRARTGLPLEICSGEEEAALSFQGATDGRYCGMIDIGGGSTEVVIGQGARLDSVVSCQMGAVRLFQRMPIASRKDVPAVSALARQILAEALSQQPSVSLPEVWIGVGGTFTTLAAMVRQVPWTERTYMHGTVITQADAAAWAQRLADMPMEERLRLPGLQPHRADIVVHGICILLGAMEHLRIPAMTVSEYGNLDGYLKRRYDLQGEISPV